MGDASMDVETICKRFGASILRRCGLLLGDGDEAQDATQEILMVIMRKSTQVNDPTAVGAWVYRLTTNHCLNHLRSRQRRAARERSEDIADWQGGGAPSPYSRALLKHALRAIVRELDDLGQQIFIYRYFDGMTQEEIAAQTHKSRRTVGKRLGKIEKQIATISQQGEPA